MTGVAEGANRSVRTDRDLWIDGPDDAGRAPNWRSLHHKLRRPRRWARRWARAAWRFFTTTPGAMTIIMVLLTAWILAAGITMAQSSDSRRGALGDLISSAEPTSYAAHNLYTSLSVADTTATMSFVQSGSDARDSQDEYNEALRHANLAATQVATGIPGSDASTMQLITDIQQNLPIYTGLIETARTHYRLGNPVGTAYLAEASALMRAQILPAAANLFQRTSDQVRTQQEDLTTPQWGPLLGLFLAVLLLVLAQYWLYRRTHRRLNKGFLVATALMSVALLWCLIAGALTWNAGITGFSEAASPMSSLTNARIKAQQARTAETLTLVRRRAVEADGGAFGKSTDQVASALEAYRSSALGKSQNAAASANHADGALQQWREAHQRLVSAQQAGDYPSASRVALSLAEEEPPTAATSFQDLDQSLSQLIANARGSMRSYLDQGLAANQAVPLGMLVLSMASIIAIWLGIRPRFLEYL